MKIFHWGLVLSLASCAAPTLTPSRAAAQGDPPYDPGPSWTIQHPRKPPSDLPPPAPRPLSTSPRSASAIEAMTPAEIARWLSSPWIATEVYKVEVNNSRAGPIVWLHQLPTFEPRLGVCTRRSWVVRYIPSEETPAASDPLVQPTGTTLSVRFRAARTAADCGADSSIDEWTSSTDSRSFAAGFRILREAVAIIGTRGRSSLRIECVNLVEPGSRICDKPDDLLRGLHPGMAAAIDQAVWSETLPRAQIFNPSNAAWRLIFPDPESPAVQDVVYVRGIQRPVAVRIERQDSRL